MRILGRQVHPVQAVAALVAVVFGLATLFAGGTVLLGRDPGYVVFRPLLIYNTAMGLAYIGAGAAIWASLRRGRCAAGAIFLLNLLVLIGIGLSYRGGGAVAVESLRAMTLRTVVWLALFLAARWLVRRGDIAIPPAPSPTQDPGARGPRAGA
jgi:hypothetical protein